MNPSVPLRWPLITRFATAAALLALAAGCASSSSGPLDKALELVGLRRPAVPDTLPKDMLPASRQVTLRLHAGDVLNTDGAGRSLAVLVRVYKLRTTAAFMQMPYEAFASASLERGSAFAQDVVEVREVVLTPGQRHEVIETMPAEASHLAVVALFRSPAPQRWRFAFETRAAAGGITLGVHGCAMSVAEGLAVDALPESMRLAGTRCS